MRKQNALYRLVTERIANRPDATPADHWQHFQRLAALGALPLFAGVEPDALLVRLRADPRQVTRVRRSSFARQVRKLRQSPV